MLLGIGVWRRHIIEGAVATNLAEAQQGKIVGLIRPGRALHDLRMIQQRVGARAGLCKDQMVS